MPPNLNDIFSGYLDDMIRLLSDLAAIESPTSDPEAVNRMGDRVIEELQTLQADVRVYPRNEVGHIVEGRWNGDKPGQPLLFVCHMDTVHPVGTLAVNPVRRKGDRLYGPGTTDMKASIVCVLYAIKVLQESGWFPARPILALMTSDEETGSAHSRDLIKERAADSALAMIMEPALPDGSLKTWRKSVGEFVLRTSGAAAHAGGAHELGVNAIEEMAHQILALQQLTNYEIGTTVSVGLIEGGTARNTIPDTCQAVIDTRAMTTGEIERLTEAILNLKPILPDASLEITGGFDRPPMERTPAMIETFERARQIGEKYGLSLTESGTGGASDGNYTASIGTPTLDGLGPIGNGAHTEYEYVNVPTMIDCATLLAALLLEWPES